MSPTRGFVPLSLWKLLLHEWWQCLYHVRITALIINLHLITVGVLAFFICLTFNQFLVQDGRTIYQKYPWANIFLLRCLLGFWSMLLFIFVQFVRRARLLWESVASSWFPLCYSSHPRSLHVFLGHSRGRGYFWCCLAFLAILDWKPAPLG